MSERDGRETSAVIDGHAHVFRPAAVLPRVCDDLAPADREAPVEDYLDVLERNGVGGAVLVPLGTEDAYVAAVLAARPGRFAGIAVASGIEHGTAGVDPVAALHRRRRAYPFAGLRTSWLGHPDAAMTDSPMLPVLRELAAHGLVLWSYLAPGQLRLLEEALDLVPDLTVVLNHLGFTPHDMQVDRYGRPLFEDPFGDALVQRLLRLADRATVHLMVSGHYALSRADPPYPDLAELTRRLVAAYGARRCLWGSDYPWIRDVPGYRAILRTPADLLSVLEPAERDAIMGGTVRGLFPDSFAAVDALERGW